MAEIRQPSVDELAAAGLYDPDAADAAERLAVLEWLLAQGLTVEQLACARRAGSPLTGMAGDLALRGGESLTVDELAAAAGMPPAKVQELLLALALPPVAGGDPAFAPGDLAAFRSFAGAAAMFGEQATLQFTRVLGSALGRIAEALVSLFIRTVETRIREGGGDDLLLARANLEAVRGITSVTPVLETFLRRHLDVAIRRFRQGRDPAAPELLRMTIGFVDLVGFTPLARRVSPADLGMVVDRFEALTHDVAAAQGGRVVKLIGDAVMFVTVRAADACEIALTLIERFADDPLVTPRGGLACGPVLMRGGDYYGPTVNLAARIGDLAVPNEILVAADVAGEVGAGGYCFEAAGKRMLKGFDAPVTLQSLTRA